MKLDQVWISTTKANQILDGGICDRTFREKFRECLPWKLTPGRQLRCLRAAVEELARTMPKTG